MADEVPKEFWELADRFIQLANELGQDWPVERVSSAMMYATARYNAFCATEQVEDVAQMRDTATDYFVEQYQAMFEENLDDQLATDD